MKDYKRPDREVLKERLSPTQFGVTQDDDTEPPFHNEFWNNKKPGIYVDVVSGEPLFSSLDKYDSKTGWPSFSRPLDASNIETKVDHKLFGKRVEVRSKHADSHLGHVFDDGPGPDGQRYCMNSASLRFVPAQELDEQGYGEYQSIFNETSAPGAASGESPEAIGDDHSALSSANGNEVAIVSGGCFWGVEDLIRKLPGVVDTEAGYTGGSLDTPTYEDMVRGDTGHAESVRIQFDPNVVGYADVLEYFFRLHDPTTMNRQGNDRGTQYRSSIFYLNQAQREIAERVRDRVDKSGKWKDPVVTQIVPASTFWPAEDYHQDYLLKHPGGYTCHFLRE